MKKRIIWLMLVFMLVLVGCSSGGPDLEGLWKADFWDNSLIGFSTHDLKFSVYADSNKAYVLDYYVKGEYSLSESDGLNCFTLVINDDSGQAVGGVAGTIEFPDENKMILTLDEKCNVDGLETWNIDAGVEKLTLRRYKGG
jgi:hypothetical protein